MDRRQFSAGALTTLSLGALVASAGCSGPAQHTLRDQSAETALLELESHAGGTLGAYVLDTASGKGFGWRAGERFAHCSSFKLSLAALMLRESDAGRIDPEEELAFSRDDLMFVSPVTTHHVDQGSLPASVLARAIVVTSDNAAANILMRRLGGPSAVTAFWREIGDGVSRLDAYEPELNRIPEGTQENSTTPDAMARTVARLTTGDVLTPGSRQTLREWMGDANTGMRRLRADVPDGWWVGDKTGTALPPDIGATYVDLGLMVPPAGAPLAVAAYYVTDAPQDDLDPAAEAVLARVATIATDWAGADA